jgi:hypothetical protein
MVESDYRRFVDIVSGVMGLYGRERSDVAVAIWWKVMQRFELESVEAALAEHVTLGKFAPTPADIIAILTAKDGRPTADEAWSMIPRDENASVIWTDEMSKAYGIAAPLLEHGDPVAARRAFIDRYQSEVARNRAAGIPVHAWPSWGWDERGRSAALAHAVEIGLLPARTAALYALQLPDGSDIHPKVSALLAASGPRRLQ